MGGWKVLVWILIVAITVWFLYLVRMILFPFVLGFIIAILLEPTIKRMRLRGVKRGAAIAYVFVVFFGLLTAITIYTAPIITNQVATFSGGATKLTQEFAAESYRNNYFQRWNPKNRALKSTQTDPVETAIGRFRPILERFGLPTTRSGLVERFVEPRRKEISTFVERFFNGFLGTLTSLGSLILILPLTPIVALLLLLDMDRIKARAPNWIPPTIRKQVMSLVADVGEVFVAYLRGMTMSWALYTATAAIVLTVLGAPFGVLLALLFGVLYLIPFFGGLMNYILLLVVTLLSGQSSNWFMSTGSPFTFGLVLVAFLLAQTWAWDTFVHPNLVGRSVGLNPLLSMFVVFAGGTLFGLVGMVIAFPIGGAIKVILEKVLKATSTSSSDLIGMPSTPLRHRISDG